jgi:hypothetical protein
MEQRPDDQWVGRPGSTVVHPGREEPAGAPAVDIVVPVYNEERVLEQSVRRLHHFLDRGFPFTWRITIVDNGSTDGTSLAAVRLARDLPNVATQHLDRKGRGLALRTAWGASDATIVAYMDVDLSTDLDALLPLVAPLVSGHSDVAIGSRLVPGASVARHPKREVISRSYNLILRTVFATRIHDAQCGFKALRADVARRLLPAIADNKWFFDTELLLLAEHNGLRVHEVPVDWVDDTDSRVRVVRTAWDDLVGSARMAKQFALGRGKVDLGTIGRQPLADDFGRSLVSFNAIGALSTAISLILFLMLRGAMGAVPASIVAVTATFVANTWANARFTTRRRGADWRRASLVYVGSILLTGLALFIVDATIGSTVAQLIVLALTWAVATIVRLRFVHRARSEPRV